MMREFISRTDVFAVQRPGGAGYQPVRRPLTDEDLLAHLDGSITVAVYPGQSHTRTLCIDVDRLDLDVIGKMFRRLEQSDIPFLTERSGLKGYHLHIPFVRPIPNKMAREIGRALTQEHEVNPKQDHVPVGKLGSLLKLFLGIHLGSGQRCLFVDNDYLMPYPDQFLFLSKIEKVDGEALWKRLTGGRRQNRRKAHDGYVHKGEVKPCIKEMLARGVQRGRRNRVAHAIACEMRHIGMVKDEARGVMRTWNLRNKPPLPTTEILTVLDSAFAGQHEYGCGDGSFLRSMPECLGLENCNYYRRCTKGGGKKEDAPGTHPQENNKQTEEEAEE